MSRWLWRTGLFVLGVGALVAFLLVPMHPLTPPSQATPIPTATFDIDAQIVPGQGWAIPADGSVWHELYPTWCAPHHQAGYEDANGDGVVSPCDNIIEIPYQLCWHVLRVTPTYFFSPVTGGPQNAAEPAGTVPGASPVCEEWHIIHADGPPFTYCQPVHIDGWEDGNQNGVLDVCDNVQIQGGWYHIDRIGCDVTVAFNPVTGAKPGTWGWLKSLFHR